MSTVEPLKENVNSTKLPPGMVLGPDGKPCKACNNLKDFKSAFPLSMKPKKPTTECPPDIEQIGRSTWTFLHTTASYYPLTPSSTQKSSMLSLLTSLPLLYPCSTCANELGEYIKVKPPTNAVGDRASLERWLCEVHNDVNGRLGKKAFDCSKVGERWRDGPKDGSCD